MPLTTIQAVSAAEASRCVPAFGAHLHPNDALALASMGFEHPLDLCKSKVTAVEVMGHVLEALSAPMLLVGRGREGHAVVAMAGVDLALRSGGHLGAIAPE